MIVGAGFAALGAAYLLAPAELARHTGFMLFTPLSVVEVQGFYGGQMLVIGAALLLVLRKSWLMVPGLVLIAVTLGGSAVPPAVRTFGNSILIPLTSSVTGTHPMPITLLYVGVLALIFLVLSYRVVQLRGPGGPSLGDGGNPMMLRRIRAHANFAEYVPIIVLMIGLLELSGLPAYVLHAMGITLVVARLLHGYALSFTEAFKFGRFWGAALTFLLLLVGGVLCVWQGGRVL